MVFHYKLTDIINELVLVFYLFALVISNGSRTFVAGEFKLTLLHTNDMHSRFEETNESSGKCSVADEAANKCFGGFARLKQAITMHKEDAQSRGRNVLFLNAGDTFQGTPYYNLFKWKIAAKMTQMLGMDAMSLGNHEFDDGPDDLANFINNVTVPVLACNLDLSGEPNLVRSKLKRSVVFKMNGFKIGVVGYVTPDTKLISNPRNVEFLDEITSLQEEIDFLRKEENVHVIIALGHSGFQKDQEIARTVRGVDMVVGGHTNTFLYNGAQPSTEEIRGPYPVVVTQSDGKQVPVLQAYAYTKYLGVFDVDFNDDGSIKSFKGNPVLLNSTIPEETTVLRALRPWKYEIDKKAAQKVGISKVLLDGGDNTRRIECNLANFITDAFINFYVRKYQGSGWTDTPIALVQGGGIRASIDVRSSNGVVTYIDVLTTLPFEDPLCRIELKGKYLLAALEWSVRFYDKEGTNVDGAFLQVSGLKVEYDMMNSPGSRVIKVLARCGNCPFPTYSKLDPEENYGIVLSHYLAEGGDGFEMFKKNRSSIVHFDETDTEILLQYINMTSPIYPGVEGRIITNFPNSQYDDKGSSGSYDSPNRIVILFSLLLTTWTYIKIQRYNE